MRILGKIIFDVIRIYKMRLFNDTKFEEEIQMLKKRDLFYSSTPNHDGMFLILDLTELCDAM